MFLLALPAGELADRFDPRRIITLASLLEAVASSLLLVFVLAHETSVWPLYAIILLYGMARGFSGPATRSLLPFLVPPEKLSRAIAWGSSALQLGDHRRAGLWRLRLCARSRDRVRQCAGRVPVECRRDAVSRRQAPDAGCVGSREPVGQSARGHRIRALASGDPRRDLPRSVRGAAGRRGVPAADLRARHPARRSEGPRPVAQRAGFRRRAHGIGPHSPAGRAQGRLHHVCHCRDLRHRHHRVRDIEEFRPVPCRPCRHGRGRSDQRVHPLRARAVCDAGCRCADG